MENKTRFVTPINDGNDSLSYIPLDYIKARIVDIIEEDDYLNSPHYEFTPELVNGDEIQCYKYKVDNMELVIMQNGLMIIQGSLHKFINNGNHNHNIFTKELLQKSLDRLYEVFKLKPQNLWIIKLEWGFNISPPCLTKKILRNLFQHIKCDFEAPILRGGNFHQVEHARYIIKIYDKAKQYHLDKEWLRIEIKQMNWSQYRAKGIETLADFIKTDKTLFLQFLIDKLREIVFYDPLIPKRVKSKYSNPNYWKELRDDASSGKYKYHCSKLREHNVKYGGEIMEQTISTIQNLVLELQLDSKLSPPIN